MSLIYSLYVINKSGGLIFSKVGGSKPGWVSWWVGFWVVGCAGAASLCLVAALGFSAAHRPLRLPLPSTPSPCACMSSSSQVASFTARWVLCVIWGGGARDGLFVGAGGGCVARLWLCVGEQWGQPSRLRDTWLSGSGAAGHCVCHQDIVPIDNFVFRLSLWSEAVVQHNYERLCCCCRCRCCCCCCCCCCCRSLSPLPNWT
jgi:hypothetical protein